MTLTCLPACLLTCSKLCQALPAANTGEASQVLTRSHCQFHWLEPLWQMVLVSSLLQLPLATNSLQNLLAIGEQEQPFAYSFVGEYTTLTSCIVGPFERKAHF